MITKVHESELVPQGRFDFNYFDEATYYPDHMKWSFNLPLLWWGKSDFEQVCRDLAAVRRFRAFLRPVSAPVYDLWTSAAYPMGVPVSCVERRYYPIDPIGYFNGMYDPRLSAGLRELSLRLTLNETYGKYGR